ncbi:MAG: hypothetical protein OIF38_11425, partial [Cellvibrionaceae bacterium]|nr:hypothetical protein [Cellvibrionaceae bacterium]
CRFLYCLVNHIANIRRFGGILYLLNACALRRHRPEHCRTPKLNQSDTPSPENVNRLTTNRCRNRQI